MSPEVTEAELAALEHSRVDLQVDMSYTVQST